MVVLVTLVVLMSVVIVTGVFFLSRRVLMLRVAVGRMVGVIGRRFAAHCRKCVGLKDKWTCMIKMTLSQDYKGVSRPFNFGRPSPLTEPEVFFVPDGAS